MSVWTKDEDLLLVETILRYVREGKTQLDAFDEVSNETERHTAAACGYRWNTYLRKHYQQAFELAVKQTIKSGRKRRKNPPKTHSPKKATTSSTFNSVITSLKEMELEHCRVLSELTEKDIELEQARKMFEEEKKQLEREIEKLSKELSTTTRKLEMIEGDYKAILDIMNKAREMTRQEVFGEKETSPLKKFKITPGGIVELNG